jgi:hypothetical protein
MAEQHFCGLLLYFGFLRHTVHYFMVNFFVYVGRRVGNSGGFEYMESWHNCCCKSVVPDRFLAFHGGSLKKVLGVRDIALSL